jgi:hypothetical protein
MLERTFTVVVTNEGRGIARFPAVRCERLHGIGLPNEMAGKSPIWFVSYADEKWLSFRGGANDVVYPGESLLVATLVQPGFRADRSAPQMFPGVNMATEAVCEGMPSYRQSFSIRAADAIERP